jgi:hypothetical protein
MLALAGVAYDKGIDIALIASAMIGSGIGEGVKSISYEQALRKGYMFRIEAHCIN